MRRLNYAKTGVDISKIKNLHKDIGTILESTFKANKDYRVLSGIGHYASLIDFGKNILTLHADGVGTKVLIAQMIDKYDTIGIDCIAMCVNDLICVGSKPIALIDYLALEKPDENLVTEIMKGLVLGATESDIAIVGGETAIMPDVIKGIRGKGFDLVGLCMGILKKGKMILGERIKPGDLLIGIESNGIHSNGMSLARKALLSKYKIDQFLPEIGKTLGDELLIPTKIYVKPILECMRKCEIHGLAHITGGAFTKLKRLSLNRKIGFILNDMPKPQPIFKIIQNAGNISKKEMYRTFNMGVGFCLCVPSSEKKRVLKTLSAHAMNGMVIGYVVNKIGVYLDGKRLDN